MLVCKICGNSTDNKLHVARELMFGLRDEFEYIECAKCGCVQIKEIPDNLARYYPPSYYSFQQPGSKPNLVKRFLKPQRARYGLGQWNPLGWLGACKYGLPNYYAWFRKVGMRFESHILDVGSGTGFLITKLREEGFRHLTGIDPFIERDCVYEDDVRILKMKLQDVEQQFDLVMLNHSFEHMAEPALVLQHVSRVLKPGHFAAIRTPICSSFAWRHYGVNWVGLDAPRHLFLQTLESMEILAKDTGFVIDDVIYESDAFQFWASEQYQRDISLYNDERSLLVNPGQSKFTSEDLRRFDNQAAELNRRGEGDQVCFLLYKPD